MDRQSAATPPPPSQAPQSPPSSYHRDRALRATSSSGSSSNGSRPGSPPISGSQTSSLGAGGSSLFGWVKSAFSAPNRAGSSSPRSATPKQLDTAPTTSATPAASGRTMSGLSGKSSLPSRHLEAEFQRRGSNVSGSSIGDGSSLGHGSIDEDETAVTDSDEDEELYIPFSSSDPVDIAANAAAKPAGNDDAGASAPTGVVRPTARRTVSLDHGDKEELDAEVARLSLAARDKSRRRPQDGVRPTTSRALTVDEAQTGAVVSDARAAMEPPSLVLTPPDSRSSEEITSPLVAGWSSSDSSSDAQTYERSAAAGDGESIEAATGEVPRPTKEMVVLGSRAAAMRSMKEEDEDEDDAETSPIAAASAEEWDESRSKTPRVLADILGQPPAAPRLPSNMPAYKGGDDLEDVTTPTDEFPQQQRDLSAVAQEISDSAAPTPKPDQGGRNFSTGQESGHQRWSASEPGYDASILKAPKAVAPARRRFFGGGRRRADSAEKSFESVTAGDDAAQADDSGSGADAVPRRNRVLSGSSSAASFWRRARKPSETSPRPSTSYHSMSASSSAASGMSIEIPDSETANSSVSGSRAPSIAASSTSASWAPAPTKKVKIKASGGGLCGGLNPRKIKSRAKGKSSVDRQFSRLYLAQELDLGLLSPEESSVAPSASSSSTRVDEPLNASVSGEFGQLKRDAAAPPNERPRLGSANSQSSMQSSLSTSSTTAAFSTTSHSTTGSYGAHGKKKATWALKFSLDGKYLAVAGQDAVVRVFQVLDNVEKRDAELRESRARAEALIYAEGSFSASHDSFGSLRSKNSAGAPSSSASGPAGSFGRSKRGSTKEDPSLLPLRHIPVFASKPVREFRGHTSDVLSLDWSKNNFLLSSSMDKTVKVWHLSKPDCLITFGHGDFVTSAVFHPKDDRFFLSGSLDGKLRLWNIAAKRVQASADVPGLITATSFSASGSTAIAGTFSGALLFYGTEDLTYQSSIAVRSSSGKNARGRKITGIEAVGAPQHPTTSGSSSSSSRVEEKILISSNDSRIRVYSLTDKRLTAKYRGSTYLNRTSQIRASTADDAYVVAGSESGEVYIWDVTRDDVGGGGARESSRNDGSSSGGGGGLSSLLARRSNKGASSSGASVKSSSSSANVASASLRSSEVCEYWTAAEGARPVTVALLAPLKTHAYLCECEDPVELHRATVDAAGGRETGATTALSALGLASALGAAMPTPLRSQSPTSSSDGGHPRGGGQNGSTTSLGSTKGGSSSPQPPGWNPRENRIVVSVDESQVLRVWRALRDEKAVVE
ncbi:WD40 repeat-like protein [Jaminaea rosea]|uniref:WD40 repeat-like protein n=1 Tax=Jaminaea rosea TaxID=1569628 RepID=A0A316US77_9BASI|nr:WD40 repeat-like protein [Jaminaea rosea]PWN25985.1 WD40 repeat-like protein [Jaminaea rosea]